MPHICIRFHVYDEIASSGISDMPSLQICKGANIDFWFSDKGNANEELNANQICVRTLQDNLNVSTL